ncbi:hypothetical protein KC340_g13799 [Hortaea werneckii]|nr:hypothetical protein KC342_g14105 [Hortaea werneckii]KAI7068319.1 hypothetical protein KC339_g15122 [Hortaea werneckii]KAI7222541.1 hypothetical protein KC365_g11375 [Hortaea werneckii]KAI7299426.1 hypothetical protein KC340_g13799 [Hortaea werneckii]KAI7387575.1 hypothetical protein KC328_g9371 [Hortaea werneckii]
MGINGLWDVIGEGEIVHIADYAAQHFRKHGRPLRIAVDEACWRFTNLTPEQVGKIRDGEPAANPVEKTILWRILRFMKLNVQLLFVYDGPSKPWKSGRGGGGLLDKELVKLLHQLLDTLKVPYHRAPGEAEAECAALEQRGVVDAVWADDGDAFMFGCQTLIKQHKVDGQRIKDYVRIYRAETILKECDLDRDSLVLFAMLAGGDYDTQGLRGCGPKTAAKASRTELGVASKARDIHKYPQQVVLWRQALDRALRSSGSSVEIPTSFPNQKALGNYLYPNISPPEVLDNLRALRQGWDQKIDQYKLRKLLRERFNIWTKGFINHFAPIYLVRALARATPEQRNENLQYAVQLKRTRKNKDDAETPTPSEVKITFSPLPAMEINLSQKPPEEDWDLPGWKGKDGASYDPLQKIEAEILQCFLDHGLPEGGVAPPPEPARRKRKGSVGEEGEADQTKKSTPKQSQDESVSANNSQSQGTPKKRGRPRKNASDELNAKKSRKSSGKGKEADATPDLPPTPPRPVFKLPRSRFPTQSTPPARPPVTEPAVQDLAGSSNPEAPTSGTKSQTRLSAPPNTDVEPFSPAIARREGFVPGESIPVEDLRELRTASSLLSQHHHQQQQQHQYHASEREAVNPQSQPSSISAPATQPGRATSSKPSRVHEVIDLT